MHGNSRDRRQTQNQTVLFHHSLTEQTISGTLNSCTLRACVLACHSFRKSVLRVGKRRDAVECARACHQSTGQSLVSNCTYCHCLPCIFLHFCDLPSVSCRHTYLACHRCDTSHPRSQLDSNEFRASRLCISHQIVGEAKLPQAGDFPSHCTDVHRLK